MEWLKDPDHLVPMLQACGARHVYYKVERSQYELIGANLLRTLERGLGKEWKPEVAKAWTAVYGVVQYWMLVGDEAERTITN